MKDRLDEKDIKLYKNHIQSMKMNLTVMKQYKNTENKVTGIEGTRMQETRDLMNNKCEELLQKFDKLSPSLSASQSL